MSFANGLTEDARIALLAEGKRLLFHAGESEPGESRASRTISADALNRFIAARAGKITTPIEIRDAVIEGFLDWKDVVFQSAVSFERCEFTGDVDISEARFERKCELKKNLFLGELTARAAIFKRDLSLDNSWVTLAATFRMAKVGGEASFQGAYFRGLTTFEQFRCDGALRCNCAFESEHKTLRPTGFYGGVSFLDADLRSSASFAGAQFWGDASFERMRTAGPAFFQSHEQEDLTMQTRFFGPSRFLGMHVGQDLDFQGARLSGPASFVGMRTGGGGLFGRDLAGNRTVFEAGAYFPHVHFGAEANFNSVQFTGFTNFYNARVSGPLSFRPQPAIEGPKTDGPPVEFLEGASFQDMHVEGGADFIGALFLNHADFGRMKVSGRTNFGTERDGGALFKRQPPATGAKQREQIAIFHGACFVSGASFIRCRFGLPTHFDASQALDWISFAGAVFCERATFIGANFGTVHFHSVDGHGTPASFESKVVVRGLVYNSIYLAVAPFLKKLNEEEHRQPFLHLESTLRRMGEEKLADEVYRKHREYERARHWRKGDYIRWTGSTFYHYLANSGLKPIRLLVFSLILLAFGTWAFHQPGALEPAESKDAGRGSTEVSMRRAFGVSLSQFLPVEIPAGRKLAPSDRFMFRDWVTYDGYATFHKLAGWLFVPLGVAAMAGLLNRRGKPASPEA